MNARSVRMRILSLALRRLPLAFSPDPGLAWYVFTLPCAVAQIFTCRSADL